MAWTTHQITMNVAVSGGIGTFTLLEFASCVAVGIKPPSSTAAFDLDLTDSDGMGLFGRSGNSGTSTLQGTFEIIGSVTLTISNATTDGLYMVKLWCR